MRFDPQAVRGLLGAALFVALSACHGLARAETPEDEYHKRLKIYQTIQPYGDTPFGENINLYTGELSFAVTDATLEGSGPTIVIRRERDSGADDLIGRILGDWSLALPRLSTLVAMPKEDDTGTPGEHWRLHFQQDAASYARCTNFTVPYAGQAGILHEDWWLGYELVTESGRQQVLKRDPGNTQKPAMGTTVFPAVTSANWQIGCLPQTSNGQVGEAFLAVSPDGTQYWLDHLVGAEVGLLSQYQPETEKYVIQRRMQVSMLVTRIEDRFGNGIDFGYSGDKLVSIDGDDGRHVAIAWSGSEIASITLQPGAQQRVWQYSYNAGELSQVSLPDGSRWTYDLQAIGGPGFTSEPASYCTSRSGLSEPGTTTVSTVTAPSGLVGTFTTTGKWHGRSYVGSYCGDWGIGSGALREYTPPLFNTNSLVKKTWSGPGLSTQTWNYSYGPAVGSTVQDPCAAAANCAEAVWTDVTDPQGNRTRYTSSNRWDVGEGRLVKTERFQGASTLLSTETLAYSAYDAGAYPAKLGESYQGSRTNTARSERWSPMQKRTTVQQDTTFTWEALANGGGDRFDVFANPVRVRSASTPGGHSRTDATAYHHNAAKWVIGQVASSTNEDTGLVESKTDYDANAMPWKTYAFGKLQQTLVYDTTSAITTGQRGTLKTSTDGNGHATTFTQWKRGIPQSIASADGTSKSSVVGDLGQIVSVTDESGAKTCYGYDAMGRINLITYPSEASAGVCDTSTWAATNLEFVRRDVAEYGLAAGHWRQRTWTGNGHKQTYYDALWRPVLVRQFDSGNEPNTLTETVTRYDTAGRAVFQSYPTRGVTQVTP